MRRTARRYGSIVWIGLYFVWSLFGTRPAEAAFFEQDNSLPALMVCEVDSYGEKKLKKEFYQTFAELLVEKMQNSNRLRVEQKPRGELMLTRGEIIDVDAAFSRVHMDAFVRSADFIREKADIRAVRYLDSLPSRPRNEGAGTYLLAREVRREAQQIADTEGVRYFLFCNQKDIDVVVRGLHGGQFVKGTKIELAFDYYLVDTESGRVYAGTCESDKTAQTMNVVLARYGKTFSTAQILHTMLENTAQRVTKDVVEKGLGELEHEADG